MEDSPEEKCFKYLSKIKNKKMFHIQLTLKILILGKLQFKITSQKGKCILKFSLSRPITGFLRNIDLPHFHNFLVLKDFFNKKNM